MSTRDESAPRAIVKVARSDEQGAPVVHRGRRPRADTPGTRERILEEATRIFNERGYMGASLREIAAAAHVDLALISYYFGNKAGLFRAAVTTVLDPLADVRDTVMSNRANAGRIIAQKVIAMMEDPSHRAASMGFFRTLVADAPADSEARELVVRAFVEALDSVVDDDEFADEYSMLVAEIVGLIFARWVVPIEPIASMEPETIETLFAERYQSRLDAIEDVLNGKR